MKEKMEMETFRTPDLHEAALICSSGKKLLRIENLGPKCWFVFSEIDYCKKLIDSFWRKEAVVNAKNFVDTERDLKTLIFRDRKS